MKILKKKRRKREVMTTSLEIMMKKMKMGKNKRRLRVMMAK